MCKFAHDRKILFIVLIIWFLREITVSPGNWGVYQFSYAPINDWILDQIVTGLKSVHHLYHFIEFNNNIKIIIIWVPINITWLVRDMTISAVSRSEKVIKERIQTIQKKKNQLLLFG
jgi:hypothetical protein